MRVDKKYFFMFFIFLLPTTSLIAKEVGTYYCNLGDNENSVVISLNSDKSYFMEIHCIIIENTFTFPISAGNYHISNKVLTLHDIYNGFKLTFNMEVDFLLETGENTFKWLKNRKLIKSDDYNNYNEDILAEGNIDHLRQLNNVSYPVKNSIYFGQYQAGNDYSFTLVLNQPNEYIYKFRNTTLSEGVFSIHKKEVMLYDTSLQHNFYLFIDGNELENVFFPGIRLWKLKLE